MFLERATVQNVICIIYITLLNHETFDFYHLTVTNFIFSVKIKYKYLFFKSVPTETDKVSIKKKSIDETTVHPLSETTFLKIRLIK